MTGIPRTTDRVPVLIASWLDQRHVDRIAAAEPERVEVLYAPELLPLPRYEADHYAKGRALSDADLARWRSLVARAEVSFDFDWDRPAELLDCAPNLRWVQSPSSGIGPMLERIGVMGSRLTVTNAAGIHAQPLAEFVVMAALYFAKEVPRLNAWKANHHWERFCGYELAGSRMLLVGLGGAGARVATLAAALGIEVIGHRRSNAAPPEGVVRVVTGEEIDAELPNVGYLVLIAPDTAETKNMFDRRRLALLPPSAVVINIGRGSLLDEPALIDMLASGQLRGAALDVFAKEPLPADNPLWSMPNVIVSPHSASTVVQENDRIVDLFIENLGRYLDGRPLVNLFDHARKY
jgi:glyoxylate/hydroxypyruvate reductase A